MVLDCEAQRIATLLKVDSTIMPFKMLYKIARFS